MHPWCLQKPEKYQDHSNWNYRSMWAALRVQGTDRRSSVRTASVLIAEPSLQPYPVTLMILLFKLSQFENDDKHKVPFFNLSYLKCLTGLSILCLWELEMEGNVVYFFISPFLSYYSKMLPSTPQKNSAMSTLWSLIYIMKPITVTFYGQINLSRPISNEYGQRELAISFFKTSEAFL